MAVATTRTIALHGAVGHLIEVQVDVSPGVVGTTLVGRPDAALHESRDRVRMAINNSELSWPATRRVTVLLSPADLPKRGTHFDLAIAVGVLGADRKVPAEALADTLFVGELALSGALRPVTGVLPMVMAAADHGVRRVFVPEPQAAEAALVPGVSVFGVRSLAQVVAELVGTEVPDAPPVVAESGSQLLAWRGQDLREETDLADLAGIEDVKYAVEVAAAGGHHLMLNGPKGSGKTSIAERIPGILPELTPEEALELTALHSLSGTFRPGGGLLVEPPFCAPHHDASAVSLLGGGTGRVRPGLVSRAHNGVLFLDEFPLFHADAVDGLRQPLESGQVTVTRGEEAATFPARPMVVLAANPCPCGNYHESVARSGCTCLEPQRRDYRRKLNGPLLDRVDIWRDVVGPGADAEADSFARTEDSATVRARVTEARARQRRRYAGRGWRLNAAVPGAALRDLWPLPDEADARLRTAMREGELSRRGAVRVHRVAWTVADLAEVARPGLQELETALALRTGAPLSLAVLERAG